jgi:hypothetical protein
MTTAEIGARVSFVDEDGANREGIVTSVPYEMPKMFYRRELRGLTCQDVRDMSGKAWCVPVKDLRQQEKADAIFDTVGL